MAGENKKAQAGATPAVETPVAGPVVAVAGKGADIGTANITVCHSQMVGGITKATTSTIRDCFITLPAEDEGQLLMSGIPFQASADGNHLIVLSDEAIKLASILGTELRRPLARGFVSDKEDLSKEVVGLILRSLLGTPQVPGELVVYSVPGAPLDEDAARAHYHTRFFSDRLKELGFSALPINEAMAVIYAEAPHYDHANPNPQALTGLGLSFGAGMVNVALVHRSLLVRAFSIPFGGDFIDEAAAKMTNSPVAQVTLLKEEGVNLITNAMMSEQAHHDAQTARQAEAISLMYRELLTKLRDAINVFFSRPENRVGDVKATIPVFVSGGTSTAHGFMQLFDEIVLQGLELRFPVAAHATGAKEPLLAVAHGAQAFAKLRSHANR